MSEARIRPSEERDLPALVELYNHYVRTTPITFDTRPFTVEDRLPWFARFSRAGPHRLLVVEISSAVVGDASSGRFRSKPAYDRSVETTIYLAPNVVGYGLGWQLYQGLLDVLRSEKSVHRAFAGITLPNERSFALHARCGFSFVGTFREAGFKFGRYWDVGWFESDLCRSADDGAQEHHR